MKAYDTIIIGAGAAGMTAAIFAARAGEKVCIIDHRSEPGKKLLQTGNGRCNLTHEGVCGRDYISCADEGCTPEGKESGPGEKKKHESVSKFLDTAFGKFGYDETLDFFYSIGIPVRNKGGYIYPYSGTALSVRNALWDEMKRLDVEIVTGAEPEVYRVPFDKLPSVNSGQSREPFEKGDTGQIREPREAEGFKVVFDRSEGKADTTRDHSDKSEIISSRLILATGLKAAPGTGSDGSGISMARQLGLKLNDVLPALVKLKCSNEVCRPAAGVRHVSRVFLEVADDPCLLRQDHFDNPVEQGLPGTVQRKQDKKTYDNNTQTQKYRDYGEVQFTEDGISGIPVFNLSRYAAIALHKDQRVNVTLDLLPDFTRDECEHFIKQHFENMKSRKLTSFFGGLLPGKLLTAVARTLSISAEKKAEVVGKERLHELIQTCKGWEMEIAGTHGFEAAQVCTGGVDISQINPETMEVKTVPGLYIVGELCDADGPCGGYNLQWAWTSGAIAGMN